MFWAAWELLVRGWGLVVGLIEACARAKAEPTATWNGTQMGPRAVSGGEISDSLANSAMGNRTN